MDKITGTVKLANVNGTAQIMFKKRSDFPASGRASAEYVATDENKIYRYDKAAGKYVCIGTNPDGLQKQIDNIVIAGTSSGDAAAEVAQARVNANGETFGTLKERLDNSDTTINHLKSYSNSKIGIVELANIDDFELGHYATGLNESDFAPNVNQRCKYFDISTVPQNSVWVDSNSKLKCAIYVFESISKYIGHYTTFVNSGKEILFDKRTILTKYPTAKYVEVTLFYVNSSGSLITWDTNTRIYLYYKKAKDNEAIISRSKTINLKYAIDNKISVYKDCDELQQGAGHVYIIDKSDAMTAKFRTFEVNLEDEELTNDEISVGVNSDKLIYALTILSSTAVLENIGWAPVVNGKVIIDKSKILALHSNAKYARLTFAYSTNGANTGITTWDESVDLFLYKHTTNGGSFKIVDADGNGDYTSLATAVSAEPSGTTMIIKPGIYEGSVRAFNKRINFIGTDREKCIIRQTDGQYANPAIECCCGYLANLTIESKYVNGTSQEIDTNTTGAYAIHCENQNGNESLAVGDCLTIHNCNIMSDFFPALGVGSFKDWSLNITNCNIVSNQISGRGKYSTSGGLGALYFHDMNGEKGTAKINVKDCIIKTGSLSYTICPYDLEQSGANIECEFINNTIYSAVNGFSDSIYWRGVTTPFGNNIHLSNLSHGNTGSALNK